MRTLKACVQHTNFALPAHGSFWKRVEQYLPAGSLEDGGELGKIWISAKDEAAVQTERKEWITYVKALNLSQPNSVTCQATCIAMAVGDKNIGRIYNSLCQIGDPGSPETMAKFIKTYDLPYKLELNATLNLVYEWLKNGEFLISHGWFTRSGHVICFDGLKKTQGGHSINVKDPWGEFNALSWSYKSDASFYDGFYSDLLIYSACVEGASAGHARSTYAAKKINLDMGGMWVHRFLT